MKSVSAKQVLSTFTFKNVISCTAKLDSSVGEYFILALLVLGMFLLTLDVGYVFFGRFIFLGHFTSG